MQTTSTTSFGALLRAPRRAAGLPQAELAERAGLSWRGVNDLERGARRTPHRDTLARLVAALGLTGEERAALEAAARRPLASAPTISPGRERELGAEPDAETRQLYERLKAVKPDPAAQPDRRAASTLIGREAEWQALMRAWAQASRGQAAMVMLIGEAGIGKTRLAGELARWADRQGISVATAHCYTAEGRLTYAPALEWLRTALFKEALRTLPDAWRSELALFLPELQVERPSSAGQPVRTRPLQRQRLFEAMARPRPGASQPLLLVIDDLHWCDRDTLDWLHYPVRFYPAPLLLLVRALSRAEPPV